MSGSSEAEEENDPDGPFAFRRKAGCQYYAVSSTMFSYTCSLCYLRQLDWLIFLSPTLSFSSLTWTKLAIGHGVAQSKEDWEMLAIDTASLPSLFPASVLGLHEDGLDVVEGRLCHSPQTQNIVLLMI